MLKNRMGMVFIILMISLGMTAQASDYGLTPVFQAPPMVDVDWLAPVPGTLVEAVEADLVVPVDYQYNQSIITEAASQAGGEPCSASTAQKTYLESEGLMNQSLRVAGYLWDKEIAPTIRDG